MTKDPLNKDSNNNFSSNKKNLDPSNMIIKRKLKKSNHSKINSHNVKKKTSNLKRQMIISIFSTSLLPNNLALKRDLSKLSNWSLMQPFKKKKISSECSWDLIKLLWRSTFKTNWKVKIKTLNHWRINWQKSKKTSDNWF